MTTTPATADLRRPMARRVRPRGMDQARQPGGFRTAGSPTAGLRTIGLPSIGRLRAMSRRRLGILFGALTLAAVALFGALNPMPAGGAGNDAASSGSDLSGVGSSLASGSAGFNLFDLGWKVGLVIVILFITLRVLGRMQSAAPRKGNHLQVLESRTLAAKASLHLVAIGDRRLVVGLTPSGMVSLAEIDADELAAAEHEAEARESEETARTASAGISLAPSAIDSLMAPVDGFAGRLASFLSGGRGR